MIDVSKEVIAELNKTGLRVHNEYFVDSKTEIPCITYRQYDNSVYTEGDTLGYSNQVFHVKVWGKDIQTLIEYSIQIDSIMRNMGFERTSINDLWLDGIGQRDMKYKALSLEQF